MNKVREGYKITEIGDIPIEWEVRYLEDVCEILDSYRKPIKASDREEMKGDIPYYGASGVIDWINDFIFDEELILLGEDGENLNSRNTDLAFKISGKSWVNNHAHVFRIANKNRDNIDFMVYYLESKDYSRYIAGSAQPKITQAQCRKFLLPSPDLKEQEKIASILSTVDEQIDNVDALIEKNKELKKGLMQTLLTKGIGHTKFKKSEIGEIPEEWELFLLENVTERMIVGLATSVTEYYRESGIPIIRNMNIKNGYFDDSSMLYLDEKFANSMLGKTVKTNDVITVHTGSNIGLTCVVPKEYNEAHTFTTLITTTKRNLLNPEYLMYSINSEYGVNEINRLQVGGGKSNLNVKEFKLYRIAVPPIEEQEKIVSILKEVDKKINKYSKKKQLLEQVKTGLIQQLLTGKIRV